ncbi:6-phosphofructokinase [Halalkalibacter alkalisediminis]|uniref:6-phosphofructokinase n=1 Tax=Halalkalibacter alkalisediminis TaxID=935616 RepID=A0ABV6N9U2_9BACI|nr:6-phosphofructokinase [Halalkalibacter alkalisediminis]
MKIGIINIESVYSIVNLLTYDMVSQLIHDHEVYSIEERTNVKQYREKDLVSWRSFGGNLLRCYTEKDSYLLSQSDLAIFDTIIVMGGEAGYRFYQHVKNQLRKKALFIPVSIYNDVVESKQSLGYDSALNTLIEDIYKIEDTISSCRYEQFRLFGIQVPGRQGSFLANDVADAVGDLIRYWDIKTTADVSRFVNEKIKQGKNHSFLIFDERDELNYVEEKLHPVLEGVSWKISIFDEAQCMGASPTASDRILAKKIAKKVISWVESSEEAGKILLENNTAALKISNISLI